MRVADRVLEEIELLVTSGFDNRESVYFHIFESMGEQLGLADEVTHIEDVDSATSAMLRAAIEEAFARKEAESSSWPVTTDSDRLRRAFDALDEQGIVALENCGFTQQEGRHRAILVSLARDELGKVTTHGYCFFHQ